METQNYTNQDLAGLIGGLSVKTEDLAVKIDNLATVVGELSIKVDAQSIKLDNAVDFLVEKIEDNSEEISLLNHKMEGFNRRIDDFSNVYLRKDDAEYFLTKKGFVKV